MYLSKTNPHISGPMQLRFKLLQTQLCFPVAGISKNNLNDLFHKCSIYLAPKTAWY